jgi:pSer/pThr/pTyr-binding forkhead associated (FHA) protein
VDVSESPKPSSELTSTIHINSLRNVPDVSAAERAKRAYSLLNQATRELLSELAENAAMFVVQTGASTGSRYLIDAELTAIGRDKKSDIFFDDATVSRKHALVKRTASGFTIADEGSLNGTYVNALSITNSKLATGDVVNIGKYKLTFFHNTLAIKSESSGGK